MKLALILAFFIQCVVSQPIDKNLGAAVVTPLNITYFFYNTQNANNAVELKYNNIGGIKNTHFQGSKDTLVLIHGWYDNCHSPMVQSIKDEVFKGRHDINVIGVDWSPVWKVSNINDFRAQAIKLGSFVADYLGVLAKNHGLKYGQTTVVGHSAGGPIVGGVGSALRGQLKSLVGLDTGGITKNDAKCVQYIHTSNLAVFGLNSGHANYYPNGGPEQPGCNGNFGCNHGRAINYFAESINSKRFVAKQCDNYNAYKSGKCNNRPSSSMGGLQLDTKASGNYYLDTNRSPPWAKG